MKATLTYAVLASLPAVLLSAVTWRLIWPRWKRAKVIVHPCVYTALAFWIGPWSVPLAWVHQVIGLTGHVWFSGKHGFKWYAVDDPARYIELSRAAVEGWVDRTNRRSDNEFPGSRGQD